MCRAHTPGYPTASCKGKDVRRYSVKAETVTTTITAHTVMCGVTVCKECVAILYSGKKWGQRAGYQGKAARGLTAERVFISPDKVWLDRQEPDGVELFIGHANGPKGPTSNLTYVEFCENAVIDFEVLVAEDLVPHDAWPSLWVLAQENGLGALRSQGFGRFDLERWEPKRSAGRNGKMTAAEVAEVAPVTSYA